MNATAYQEKTRASVKAEGERLWLLLQGLPKVKACKPTVNFILLDISGTGYSAALFREKLLQRQIMIRDCSNYPGLSTGLRPGCCKVPPMIIDALLAALQAVLKGEYKGMTKIILVRHGETKWNLLGRYQGQTDIALSDKGLQQAQMLAERFAFPEISAAYSSDLQRAYKTASFVADPLFPARN